MLSLMSLKARRGAGAADNVWLSLLGLHSLDAQLGGIAEDALGPVQIEHRAQVDPEGWLTVRGRANGREFTLHVSPDQWGWCNSSIPSSHLRS